jgi:uncharacterized protein YciI
MDSQTRLYLLKCTVDPAKGDRLAGLRAAHLAHIVEHRDKIVYGGAMGPADKPAEGICLVVQADSFAEASTFASADPYGPTYSSICVHEFQQRIPEKYEGQLADVLDALTADAKKTTR